MGKVKRLELWWQLYHTSLPVWDLENFRPMNFCWHECTLLHSLQDKAMHVTSWERMWTSLVILTIVNLSKLWTNLLQSNPIMTWCNYSSSSSIAHNLWKSVSDIDISCCVTLRLMMICREKVQPDATQWFIAPDDGHNSARNMLSGL